MALFLTDNFVFLMSHKSISSIQFPIWLNAISAINRGTTVVTVNRGTTVVSVNRGTKVVTVALL